MYNIVASKVINDLVMNTDETSQLIYNEVVKAKQLSGKPHLMIEIETDDDFPVNGECSVFKMVDIGERSLRDVFIETINSLDFGEKPYTNEKLIRFLDYLMSDDFLEQVDTGHASGGGNQCIDVRMTMGRNFMNLGSLTVDLTK